MFLIPYIMTAKCSMLNGMTGFMLLSSYVVAFTGFLEFFNLGRFRNNKIFLITTMLVWWVFIPWMVFLMLGYNVRDNIFVASISPLSGFSHAVSLLIDKHPANLVVLVVPFFIASLMWILARQEHSSVERQAGFGTSERRKDS